MIERLEDRLGNVPPPCAVTAARFVAMSTLPPASVAPQGSVVRSFKTLVSVWNGCSSVPTEPCNVV